MYSTANIKTNSLRARNAVRVHAFSPLVYSHSRFGPARSGPSRRHTLNVVRATRTLLFSTRTIVCASNRSELSLSTPTLSLPLWVVIPHSPLQNGWVPPENYDFMFLNIAVQMTRLRFSSCCVMVVVCVQEASESPDVSYLPSRLTGVQAWISADRGTVGVTRCVVMMYPQSQTF